jgi:hypothetical protein
MSEQTPPNSRALPDDDPQAGEVIAILKELEQDTSPFFLRSVRRKIHRRSTASQLLSFSWQMPGMAFMALGSMLVHVLSAFTNRKGD